VVTRVQVKGSGNGERLIKGYDLSVLGLTSSGDLMQHGDYS
jgi:hypothetical protein